MNNGTKIRAMVDGLPVEGFYIRYGDKDCITQFDGGTWVVDDGTIEEIINE